MKRFLRIFCLAVLLVSAVLLFGAQVVETLRNAALPPALPYGLTILDTLASKCLDSPGLYTPSSLGGDRV